MDFTQIDTRGIVLLGCGKMGGAMLAGWLSKGLSPAAVHVIDPAPSDWLRGTGVALNAEDIEVNGFLPDGAMEVDSVEAFG